MLLDFLIHNVKRPKMLRRIGRWLPFCILVLVHIAHCQSSCTVDKNNVGWCAGISLIEVPKDLPPNLVELNLSHNKLQSISKTDFSAYTNLRVLNLAYNRIYKIENESFVSNGLLEMLSLFNNSLTEIPSLALSPLKNLKQLEMSNNLYVNSTLDYVFSTFKNLQVLSMGGSEIQWIRKEDFLPLENIALQKFALKAASSPKGYEKGAFAVLNTSALWCDFALDTNPYVLPVILRDLHGKSMNLLRLRNLFWNSYYTDEMDLFNGMADVDVKELVLYRGKINENVLRLLLLNVEMSNITQLSLIAIDFARSINSSFQTLGIHNLSLNKLLLQDISNPDILRFDWTFTWFSKVINLFIINVNFNDVPCDAWDEMQNVVMLNISTNRLTNEYINSPSCRHPLLPKLEHFNVSDNKLTSLKTISILTFQWPSLRVLDLSYNGIGALNEYCSWGPAIKKLSLHHNILRKEIFQCLPTGLEYLDLSSSELDQLPTDYFSQTTNLRELRLSNNRIKFIPSNWESPNLQVLTVDGNSFGVITKGTFEKMPNLAWLKAGNNPYHCTCELSVFVAETLQAGYLNFVEWPHSYICYHPEEFRSTMVNAYSPPRLQCDVTLVVVISVTTTAVVVILSMLLCWKFDVPWYFKATCQIIQSKYRSRKDVPYRTYTYHAFVSYSCSDADWVRTELLYRLEHCSPPYSICIHERDFLPGRWIIDNIIENIEKSCKVIFVLSRSFVDSEWCNYELYFAHQRSIGHAFDDVILVVKENISLDSLPNKFRKLRKMLKKKTYLEWPSETNKQPFFWMQLKSILGKCNLTVEDQGGLSVSNQDAFIEMPVVLENAHTSVPTVSWY